MNDLNTLLSCGYPWAAARAQTALQIQSSVASGQLSKSEATELLNDLIATDKLDAEANDFATRTKLVNAVESLITVISDVTSIPGL